MYLDSWGHNEYTHKGKFIEGNRRNTIARKERRIWHYRDRFDGPGVCHERIKSYESWLCMFSFYQMDCTNINKCNGNPSKEN